MTFFARRAREHLGRLSLIVLIVVLAVVSIGALDAVAQRMLASGASEIFARAEPDAQTARVVAYQAADPAAQDTRVRKAVAEAFTGADVDVSRQVEVEARVQSAQGEQLSLRLLQDDRIIRLGRLAEGTWPTSGGQFALTAPAARRADLTIGDAVTLTDGGTPLTLAGTWKPGDPADPAWLGDPSVASGESDGVIGPAVVDAAAFAAVQDTPTVTWQITPTRTAPADIPGLQRALTALQDLPDAVDPQHHDNVRIDGELGATLERQAAALAGTRGLLVAPPLILALLGALVLGVVLRTLAVSRREELALLRARGASSIRLASTAAAEIAVVAAAGALLALAALAPSVGITGTGVLAATAAVALSAVAAATFTVRSGMRPDTARSDAGLRSLAAVLLPALVAAGAAALPAWQLFGAGSVVREDGTADPLAAAAPALLLIAACALAPAVAVPLAGLAERLLRRTRGISPILPLRQLARRMGGAAIAILCLALATASVALAVAAPSAARSAEQGTRIAQLAGDVRMIADDALDVRASEVASWPGVRSVSPVLRTRLVVGSDEAVLLAAPSHERVGGMKLPVGSDGGIPVEVTRSLADRLEAAGGTVFTGEVRFSAQAVRFRVARIVDSLPTVGTGWGVAVAAEQLSLTGADIAPDELWVDSNEPADTVRRLRAATAHPARLLTAAQVSATPVTSVAPTVLSAGALAAAALGVLGFLAAASAMGGERRGEPVVLRALGLSRRRQRAMRTGETAGVAIYAVLVGGALGAVVAWLVLPVVLGAGA
ncbi:FtsX-like permease family protein [Microbacterium sp.]|uniref:FtsX-like permease family protein n=1 Tax=Microbacterium sp. TaxID=51671 RepID=UPI003C787411